MTPSCCRRGCYAVYASAFFDVNWCFELDLLFFFSLFSLFCFFFGLFDIFYRFFHLLPRFRTGFGFCFFFSLLSLTLLNLFVFHSTSVFSLCGTEVVSLLLTSFFSCDVVILSIAGLRITGNERTYERQERSTRRIHGIPFSLSYRETERVDALYTYDNTNQAGTKREQQYSERR